MKSRDIRSLKWDDLKTDNFLLEDEKWQATNELAAITWENQRLVAEIYKKNAERTWRLHQIVSDVAKMIIQHPEDTITHLHSTFGTVMTNEQEDYYYHSATGNKWRFPMNDYPMLSLASYIDYKFSKYKIFSDFSD